MVLSASVLAEEMSAVLYKDAKVRLYRLKLVEKQIKAIENAEEVKSAITGKTSYRIRFHEILDHPELMKRLLKLKLVKVRDDGGYWLTKDGLSFRNNLLAYRPKNADPEVQDKTNINLGRDGLALTVTKIWYVVRHREEIRAKRFKGWLKEFQANQEAVDRSVRDILLLNSKVYIAPPPKKVTGWWTEAMQRSQNDLYWLNPGAFWLNPRGLLADPTPAPDWWVAPDYQPKVQIADQRDDIVENSLQAPRATETVEVKVKQVKHKPKWLCSEGNWLHGSRIWGFETQDEVERFIAKRKAAGKGYQIHLGWTITREGGSIYPEMLEKFLADQGANVTYEYEKQVEQTTLQNLEGMTNWADEYLTLETYDYRDPELESAKAILNRKKAIPYLQMIKDQKGREEVRNLILKHRHKPGNPRR